MSKPGPIPKPTKLKILEGNPGCRKLNDAEPPELKGWPDPPDCLNAVAMVEWNRLCRELTDMGIMSRAYRSSIAARCMAWARFEQLCRQYDQVGNLSKTPNGHVQPSAIVSQLNQVDGQIRAWDSEFGLTPAAKSRVTVNEKTDDELDLFLGAG